MRDSGKRAHTSGQLLRRLRRGGAVAIAVAATLAGAASASAAPALTWTPPAAVFAGLDGVSCPAFGLCAAVAGTTAQVNNAPSSSSTWTSVATGATHTLASVSCAPGTTLCVAVGASDQITATSDAQSLSAWVPPTTTPPDPGNDLASVSCPSASFCLAVDDDGNAIWSANPGAGTSANWTLVSGIASTTSLIGVSCPTSTLCVAVDASGDIRVSTTPTSGGLWPAVYTTSGLTGISCSLSGTCVAVTSSGKTVASSDPSDGASSAWTSRLIDSAHPLTSVSCSAVGFCIAGDSSGDVYESDNPGAAPPTWSAPATPPDSAAIAAVSCVVDGLCAAVDASGDALTATLPAPSVTTGVATPSSQTTATLSATVTPSDATITSCSFNYGTSTSYGASVACSTTPSATGGAQTVTAQISGLTAGTTYDFQVVVTSADGRGTGSNSSFATPAALKATVSITGTPAVGDTLTCALSIEVPTGITVTYKWVRDTTTIAGAVGGTYLVALADESHHLTCSATISGDGGSTSGTSGYVAVPAETLGTIDETTVSNTSASGSTVSTTIDCTPQALTQCTISLHLTAGSSRHPTAIGSKTERLAAGASLTVSLSLNANGRRLLAAKRHLKATLTVSGTIVGVVSGTIRKQTITLTGAHHTRRHAARDGG